MIDKATVQRIKDTADIVDVVSDYVKLTRRGANFMGLCPFHNERTPSFSVNKAKNFCYCFSCHKGGSPVNFIMEKEGISYQDALRQLAKKYGIKIVEKDLTDEERREQSERESLFIVNEWAMSRMEDYLLNTQEGRNIGLQYIYGRGITEEAIHKFHLGYSLDRNVLETEARNAGYDPQLLKSVGLLGTSQQGHTYDRFHGRVMFPVLNTAGKVVAFGGRDLNGAPAKYINSPESSIYKKSNELYGLYQARTAIVKEDKCYLVEGYMDVIGMWQSGMQNVVASSGTALTDPQIALIHRFTENVTLIYDGDMAGIKASLRGIDMLLSHNLNIKVLLLPDGDDPDSFARKHTPEEFQEYVKAHEQDFITFKTEVLLQSSGNDPQAKARVATSIVESLCCISDKVKRSIYVKECSRLLSIDEQALSYATDKRRHQVVENIIKERKRKEAEAQYPTSTPNTGDNRATQATSEESQQAETESTDSTSTETVTTYFQSRQQNQHPEIVRIESALIRYCVRYGMTPFTIFDGDEEREGTLIEYIQSELNADDIHFQNALNQRMFSIMLKLLSNYTNAKEQHDKQLSEDRAKRFREGIDAIAAKELDMDSIEYEEKALNLKLDEDIRQKEVLFARDYLSSILVSHEDDEIRQYAINLVSEKYSLSKYHNKTGKIETEADKLFELVPRTLNELRAQMLEIQMQDIETKLSQSSDVEEQMSLMKQLQELQELRKEFAIHNGERIVNPRL
jgi:DNA primase